MLTPWFWTLTYRTVGEWISVLISHRVCCGGSREWTQVSAVNLYRFCICQAMEEYKQALFWNGLKECVCLKTFLWPSSKQTCTCKRYQCSEHITPSNNRCFWVFSANPYTHTSLKTNFRTSELWQPYLWCIATAFVPRGKGALTAKANWSLSHSTLELKFKVSGQFLLVA